jgi:multicomponent Na+:H+ antiporter subunit D
MSEQINIILLWLTPSLPLINCLLLAVPALRKPAMRWSPFSALPAVVLALFGTPGITLAVDSTILLTGISMDELGRIFLGFTAVLWLLADWFAHGYLSDDRHPVRFHLFFLLSMAGNFMLLLAQDIPTFYSGFALMGFASCGLVVHRGDPEAVRAGRIYLSLAALGEVILFVALGQLATRAGATDIASVVHADTPTYVILLLLVGFGIKAGALTLHFWLPLAHPAAPVPASAVLSGAMIKAGLFGWLRFLPLGLIALPSIGVGLVVVGLGAAFIGALFGISQRNPKTVLAYSSISQMGVITVGVGVGFLQPQAWPGLLLAIGLYAVHHGLAKGALFLGVTPAHEAATPGERRFARVGLLLPALALAGAPFTSGTIAKLALKAELDYLPGPWGPVVGVLLTFAAMGTTLLMARFLILAWPQNHGHTESNIHRGIWLPWGLSIASVAVGFWILPGSLAKMSYAVKPEKVWGSLWPVLAGAALALLAHGYYRWRGKSAPQGVPAGDIVVPFERVAARWSGGKAASVRAAGKKDVPRFQRVAGLLKQERWLRPFSHGVLLLALLLLLFILLPRG